MNKKVKYAISAVAALGLIIFCTVRLSENVSKPSVPTLSGNGLTVLIDPGHGGKDPGAVSENGTRECDLNLAVANCLKDYLTDKGFGVIMTRTGGENISNEERKRVMRETECDAVVSIHMNKFSDPSVHGAETFFFSESDDGKRLAEYVQSSMKSILDSENKRTVKGTTNLFAVKTSKSPSVLVECGYISNPEEEKKLNTIQYQRRIAYALCCGIESYFAE